MAANKGPPSTSIITVVQSMVKSGESEEKIIKALQDLGVSAEQAKRLLLLAEANTFAVLQNEISNIVKEYAEQEKPRLVEFIRKEAEKAEQEMTIKVERRALNAFKEDQSFIENQATMFQARVNQSVKNIMQLNDQTKTSIADLGSKVSNMQRDVWALKHRVFGSKLVKAVSSFLLGLQTALIIASAYLFAVAFSGIQVEVLVMAMVIGAIMATIVYVVGLRS